jgi:hypothetical protein
MHIRTAQHSHHQGWARHVVGDPGQYPLSGRVEDLQLCEQEAEADNDADGGESSEDALHGVSFVLYRCTIPVTPVTVSPPTQTWPSALLTWIRPRRPMAVP